VREKIVTKVVKNGCSNIISQSYHHMNNKSNSFNLFLRRSLRGLV